MSKDRTFAIPSIRGRIAERLQRAERRFEEGDKEMEFPDQHGDVMLSTPEERGVVAIACLILRSLREDGGTSAPKRPLENLLRKTLSTFDRKDVMDIEIEAYETLLWIAKAIDPEWVQRVEMDVDEIDPEDPTTSQLDLLRWAIAGGHDLEMDYYTHGRGELTHRRVTPISLEAETYLHGYCHLRRDERVFRVSRIADLCTIEQWADQKDEREVEQQAEERRKKKKKSSESAADDDSQMSLLDDV